MTTLKHHAKALGLKQRDIAERLGAPTSSVSEWFNRQADIPTRYIQPLADVLAVPVADVVAQALRED
jgi:transcriptional regulator with XRE-family HTH domain